LTPPLAWAFDKRAFVTQKGKDGRRGMRGPLFTRLLAAHGNDSARSAAGLRT